MTGTETHRGEVWLVDLGEPVGRERAGRRPAVVVSSDRWNEIPAGIVIVVPVTTRRRSLDSHIEIEPNGSGLDEASYAKCEDIRSISEERLIHRLGVVGPAPMFSISRAIRFLLEL